MSKKCLSKQIFFFPIMIVIPFVLFIQFLVFKWVFFGGGFYSLVKIKTI